MLMFCLGRIILGMAHPLGQIFCDLVYSPLRNLGMPSSMIQMCRSWVLWFCRVRGDLGVTSTLHLEEIPP